MAALAALPDGRLVSAPSHGVILLWDISPAAAAAAVTSCRAVGVMHAVPVGCTPYDTTSLVPLPGGRLVSAGPLAVQRVSAPVGGPATCGVRQLTAPGAVTITVCQIVGLRCWVLPCR